MKQGSLKEKRIAKRILILRIRKRAQIPWTHNEWRKLENLTLPGDTEGMRNGESNKIPTWQACVNSWQEGLAKVEKLLRATRKGKLWRAIIVRAHLPNFLNMKYVHSLQDQGSKFYKCHIVKECCWLWFFCLSMKTLANIFLFMNFIQIPNHFRHVEMNSMLIFFIWKDTHFWSECCFTLGIPHIQSKCGWIVSDHSNFLLVTDNIFYFELVCHSYLFFKSALLKVTFL